MDPTSHPTPIYISPPVDLPGGLGRTVFVFFDLGNKLVAVAVPIFNAMRNSLPSVQQTLSAHNGGASNGGSHHPSHTGNNISRENNHPLIHRIQHVHVDRPRELPEHHHKTEASGHPASPGPANSEPSNNDNKKEVNSVTEPMPPVGQKEETREKGNPVSKEVSKETIDLLVKLIAKMFPEKLNFVFIPPKIQPSTPLPTHLQPHLPSKDDKTTAEQAQKDPQNSNMAVPKESVKPSADQPSYKKPEVVDKPQNVMPMPAVQPHGKNEKAEASPIANMENTPKEVNSSQPIPQGKNSEKHFVGPDLKFNPANIEATPKVVPPAKSPPEAHAGQPEKIMVSAQIQNKEQHATPQAPPMNLGKPAEQMGMNKNLQAGFYIKDLGLNLNEPLGNILAKQNQNPNHHAHLARIDSVHAEKHVNPRRDALPALDKNESVPNQPLHKYDDDRQIARMPIMPDLPLTREGILKDGGNPKDARLREDEGYRFGDMILMLLCAVICGKKNASEITRYLESKEKFFTAWMGLKNGMPTFRMLWFLLNRLDPAQLENLMQQALGKSRGNDSVVNKINVWESSRGLTLGELSPLTPKREASLLKEALGILDINGAVVNVDAASFKHDIARQIKWNGGEYIMTLKGCHGKPYEQALEFFEATLKERKSEIRVDTFHDISKEGNRHELREITVTDELSWFEEKEEWPFLRSAVQLVSEAAAQNRISTEKRMYLTSLSMQAEDVSKTLRMLSVIEGHVDWLADCDFLFSGTKGLVEHEQRNFEILRRFSTNMLANDTSAKGTTEAKRKKALADNDFLRVLIDNIAA